MRMKVKGRCEIRRQGRLLIHAERVYSQCRKYIQARVLTDDSPQPVAEGEVIRSESLTAGQQERIAQADTFFIASYHPETGADAAHRGGNPGFVEVTSPTTLAFPNYWGNLMFNTLGNISLDPHAGLLFPDFATGTTLQITGTAEVVWDKEKMADFPGANQLVEYKVNRILEMPHALPLRWRFVAYSGSNPA
jgi:predicted pyridoxine 5'-phosphate oxidase superfamily flavin-nucleotide-binding protein